MPGTTLTEPMFEESAPRNNRSGKALMFFALLLGGAGILSLSHGRREEPMALWARATMPVARALPQMSRALPQMSNVIPQRMPLGSPPLNSRPVPLDMKACCRGYVARASIDEENFKTAMNFDMSTVTFPIKATCELAPKGKPCHGGEEPAPGCKGMVKMTQLDADTIEIEWDIEQAGKEGLHGFHVHEVSDFSNGCISAGPHYNPFNQDHGAPEDDIRHVGSLGNIKVDANGKSSGKMKDRQVKLYGPLTCIGRSMMVHEDEDDLGLGDNSKAHLPGPPQNGFVSKITGNAGARIACGEIVLEKP